MIQKLYNDLKKFGLNPDEWVIEFPDKKLRKAEIRNICDSNYFFTGLTQFKKVNKSLQASWVNIRLAAL